MTAAIAMADYTGPEADNLCYAIRKKNAKVLREHEAKFKAGAKKKGIPPGGGGPGLRRVRAVRALRLQQGACHVLRAHRVPDRVPEGQLPGRVHDRGLQRLPRTIREGGRGRGRVPPAGDRGPSAGRPALGVPVRGRDRCRRHARHPVRARRREERGRVRGGLARRGSLRARGRRRSVRLARRPVPPGGSAAHQQARGRITDQGQRPDLARVHGRTARPVGQLPWTRPRVTIGTWQRASPPCSTCLPCPWPPMAVGSTAGDWMPVWEGQ